jgi:hypothetical protein
MTETTVLKLLGMGVTPYSARGLTQTLAPIDEQPYMRRTINGSLRDLSDDRFKKYKSTITGTDQQPPAVDGSWTGKIVVVDCITELAFPEYGGAQRPVVEGSEREEDGFVFYRPRLTMMITAFSISRDEYQARVGWQMDLAEV